MEIYSKVTSTVMWVLSALSLAVGGMILLMGVSGIQGMSGGEGFAGMAAGFGGVFALGFALIGVPIGVALAVGRKQSVWLGAGVSLASFGAGGGLGGALLAALLIALDRYEWAFRRLTGGGPLGVFLLLFLLMALSVAAATGALGVAMLLRSR